MVHHYRKYETELFGEIPGFDEMHCLHAHLLEFEHPVAGKTGQFTAKPRSAFAKVLGKLRTIAFMQ